MVNTRLLIDKIFWDVKYKVLFSYFYDLPTYNEDLDTHKMHLNMVLGDSKNAGLTVSPGKVIVASSRIELLGL